MGETTHTGGWKTNIARRSDNGIHAAHVIDADGASVCQVSIFGEAETVDRAALLSAAPELLTALSNLASWFRPQEAAGGSNARLFKGMPPHAVIKDALAAIEKATS